MAMAIRNRASNALKRSAAQKSDYEKHKQRRASKAADGENTEDEEDDEKDEDEENEIKTDKYYPSTGMGFSPMSLNTRDGENTEDDEEDEDEENEEKTDKDVIDLTFSDDETEEATKADIAEKHIPVEGYSNALNTNPQIVARRVKLIASYNSLCEGEMPAPPPPELTNQTNPVILEGHSREKTEVPRSPKQSSVHSSMT